MAVWIFVVAATFFILGLLFCYFWISYTAKPFLFKQVVDLPEHHTALLLGTAKWTKGGGINLFFSSRIEKAAEVFEHHKTKQLIISGADKNPKNIDEVDDMFFSLKRKNIKNKNIIRDHYGVRTWASVWRCKKVFHVQSPLFISQRFHNQRAVFIALKMGMQPIAINAEKVGGKMGKYILLREVFARVKCILDCYLLKPIPYPYKD